MADLAKVLWYYNLLQNVDSASCKIVCPFHDDVNPSMIVDLSNDLWYCFGCGRHGDAKKFVIEMEHKLHGLNDLQSIRKYFQILKSDKCSNITFDYSHVKRFNGKPSKVLYDEAYDYYHGLSKVDWRMDSDIDEVNESKDYMFKRGFDAHALNISGAKVTYNNNYGIIFPMLDNGVFKGWVCRTMVKSVEANRKYLYNKGFKRRTTLVGDYGDKDYVFIVEGYMDRLKFLQYGVSNVVAILGWKITDEQKDKLKSKGIKRVISALDNDECGRKGTQFLKTVFDVTRFQYIKGVKDPGEMTKDIFNKCYRKTMQKFRKGE